MDNIINLEEIFPNNWRARYQGNYGVYTIKLTLDGKQVSNFFCSCPSDGYPCKHIAIVKEAIAGRIAESQKPVKEKEITIERLLKDVPQTSVNDNNRTIPYRIRRIISRKDACTVSSDNRSLRRKHRARLL
jgi:hypothetical protein